MSEIRKLGDLPNKDGFQFTGIRHDDVEVACVVVGYPVYGTGGALHTYHVEYLGDGLRCFSELKGWKP